MGGRQDRASLSFTRDMGASHLVFLPASGTCFNSSRAREALGGEMWAGRQGSSATGQGLAPHHSPCLAKD